MLFYYVVPKWPCLTRNLMKIEFKFSLYDIIGLALIVLILLYFPYQMIVQHSLDNIANSYYHFER